MTKFWSSLRQRLTVRRIDMQNDDAVAVTHNFIGPTGMAYDGAAAVKTIRSGGRTLIQSISADCWRGDAVRLKVAAHAHKESAAGISRRRLIRHLKAGSN